MPELFAHGDYQPLTFEGPRAGSVLGFIRRHQGEAVCVLTARFPAHLGVTGPAPDIPNGVWDDLAAILPEQAAATWSNALTDEPVAAANGRLPVAAAFRRLPVAVLVASES